MRGVCWDGISKSFSKALEVFSVTLDSGRVLSAVVSSFRKENSFRQVLNRILNFASIDPKPPVGMRAYSERSWADWMFRPRIPLVQRLVLGEVMVG